MLVTLLLATSLAACTAASRERNSLPVPTFAAAPTTEAAADPIDPGLPDDCERVLPVAQLGALLGLPLDSVAVRSTVGVPAPSVGRAERLTCRYSGAVGGPVLGMTLLDFDAGGYVDEEAAAKHWRLNADTEDGERRDVRIGSAPAVLVGRPAETVLTVVNETVTLTLVLPVQVPRPGGRVPADTLFDLALRVLAPITPPAEHAPTPAIPMLGPASDPSIPMLGPASDPSVSMLGPASDPSVSTLGTTREPAAAAG